MKDKDFWTHVALFTSKDGNLNKAHVRYLESRLITLAAETKRSKLDNGTAPNPPPLAEPRRADAEAFLRDMLVIYPVLGLQSFEMASSVTAPGKRLRLRGLEAEGEGRSTPEGFIVFEGARARKDEVDSIHAWIAGQRQALLEQGVLDDRGDHLRLTQDYVFSSPSMAAGVLLARSANGRAEWKDDEGRALNDIEAAAVGAPLSPSPSPR